MVFVLIVVIATVIEVVVVAGGAGAGAVAVVAVKVHWEFGFCGSRFQALLFAAAFFVYLVRLGIRREGLIMVGRKSKRNGRVSEEKKEKWCRSTMTRLLIRKM